MYDGQKYANRAIEILRLQSASAITPALGKLLGRLERAQTATEVRDAIEQYSGLGLLTGVLQSALLAAWLVGELSARNDALPLSLSDDFDRVIAELSANLTRRELTELERLSSERAAQIDRGEYDSVIATATALSATLTGAEIAKRLVQALGSVDGWRFELMAANGVQTSFNQGRAKTLLDPDFMQARPYWHYLSILDSVTTEICRSLNGTVLPAGTAWWFTHYPPMHHNCRSFVAALTGDMAKAIGIGQRGSASAAPGFGILR